MKNVICRTPFFSKTPGIELDNASEWKKLCNINKKYEKGC